MKKILVGILLSLVAILAFALPRPSEIEAALAAGNYRDAQSMTDQVLRERPDSARAHLLNAYLLIHVNHDKTAANAELNTAYGLDKIGDVKGSPLFGRVVAEIDTQRATAPPSRQSSYQQSGPVVQTSGAPVVQSTPPKQNGHGFALFVVVLIFAGIAVLAYLWNV